MNGNFIVVKGDIMVYCSYPRYTIGATKISKPLTSRAARSLVSFLQHHRK